VPDVGRYLDIPKEWKDLDTHHPAVPPLFIVHAQVMIHTLMVTTTFFYTTHHIYCI
jgi:hypothetical protein